VLRVDHLSKSFDGPPSANGQPAPRLDVLRDVSLTLKPGDSASIVGASGSGKSTLLYICGGLDRPTAGTITLGDTNPHTLDAKALAAFRNRRVGFVFQDHCLLPQCSVLENVLVPTLVATGPVAGGLQASGPGDDKTRAASLIEQVGLSDRIDHRPGELSGGEKQRVAIARALIRQPRLVLCDEPTGNLDQASAATVASLLLDLHRLQQNILIVVTHSATLSARFPVRFEISDKRLTRVA
jgi:lipoprotein-releasing system ATP-binding protein